MTPSTGFVETMGARLYYERMGSGAAVLFLHAGVADLRMWDAQVEALSRDFDCIRFDMRGFGRTTNKADAYSPREDIAAVLDHLQVESAHIVGISAGGFVALDFTLEHPERVSSIALLAAGVSGLDYQSLESELAAFEEMERLTDDESWDQLVELELQMWLDGPGRAGRIQGEVRERMREMCRGAYGRTEPHARAVPIDPPAAGRLSEIKVPALVVSGTYDVSGEQAASDYLAKEIPGAKRLDYEGVAHMINLEQPERFNSDLLAFLKTASSSK